MLSGRRLLCGARRHGGGWLSQGAGVLGYTTGADAAGPRKGPRTKYMGLRELSPAVDRLAATIGEKYEQVDIKAEIDGQRFSAADLFSDLPKYYTAEAGSAASMATGGDLATVSKERALGVVREMRQRRSRAIEGMFRQDQLKAYLAMHGQRVSGTKGVLVERIIDSVWGITAQSLVERSAEAEQRPDEDGVTMRLSDDAAAQVAAMEDGALAGIAKEFDVAIEFRASDPSLRVTGRIQAARAALSVLREKLAADATVQVRLERYGTPRPLPSSHISQMRKAIHWEFRDRGTVTFFDGELFVRGQTRGDSLAIQHALVEALVEPAHTTLFVVVPAAAEASALTVVAATDLVSAPRGFTPAFQFAVDRSAASGSPLNAHMLFRRQPAQSPIEHLPATGLAEALRDWAAPTAAAGGASAALSFHLGHVMFDIYRSEHRLYDRLQSPAELLGAISQCAPLFGFSASISPLKWLHSQSAATAAEAAAPEQQLVLTFRRVPDQPGGADAGAGLGAVLPVLSRDKLVARIGVAAGKVRYGGMSAELVLDEERANVAILPGAHDLEATVAHYQPVDAADAQLVEAMRGVVRQLGDASTPDGDASLLRHGLVDTPLGQFTLAAAELDTTTRKPLAGGLAICVHQVWDILERQRYSRVAIHPQPIAGGSAPDLAALLSDAPAWERTVQRLLEIAVESPAANDAAQLRRSSHSGVRDTVTGDSQH